MVFSRPVRSLGYALFLVLVAWLTLAACGGEKAAPAPTSAPAPALAGSLVVYSGRSKSLVGPIIDQFKQASGIDVAVKYAGTSEVAATLLEEGKKSPADVFFAQEPGGLGAVASLLAPLPVDIVGLVPDWARSPDARWVGISGRARVVVYNTNKLSETDLPASISGFTDPKWKDRIGWAPANASFQTMVTAMRALWGEDRTRQWLLGIKANKPKQYPNNTTIVAATAAGEIDAGFVNHYYLYQFIQENGEGFPARNYYSKEGDPGSLIMVAGAGILQTAKHRGNAEKFLRFMLSPVAQQYFAGQTFEYPLVPGVNTHRLLVPLAQISNPKIDVVALGDIKGTQALLRDLGILP